MHRAWAEVGGLDASANAHAATSLAAIDEAATSMLEDARYQRPFFSTAESERHEWATTLEAGVRVRIVDLAGAADAELRDDELASQAPMLDGRPATLLRFEPLNSRWLLSVDAHAGFGGPEPLPGASGRAGGHAAADATVSVRAANLAPLVWRAGVAASGRAE